MIARLGARIANGQHAADFGKGESCRLRRSDEPQSCRGRFVVFAVTVGGALRFGEEAPAFIESDGFGSYSEFVGELSDEHVSHNSP